ncbi:MAG: MarR family transcriptional regulator [Pirellulales bacterium]
MNPESLPADSTLLDLLRRHGALTIGDLAERLSVTATAVRQRLNRLMGQGLIQRTVHKAGRGRPSHHYELTTAGRRHSGSNFADLAMVLWDELRSVEDPGIRRGLLERICQRLSEHYRESVQGQTVAERMASVADLFRQRRVPVEVETCNGLPVINALACPYPDLAEQDRSICAMERMLFAELIGESLQLTACRLDGESCCRFEPAAVT